MISLSLNTLHARIKLEYIDLIKKITNNGYSSIENDFRLNLKYHEQINIVKNMLSKIDEEMEKEFNLMFTTYFDDISGNLKLQVIDPSNEYDFVFTSK